MAKVTPPAATVKAIPTRYANVNFRSRLEAKWAAFFDFCHWSWFYEPVDFDGWIPDFALFADGVTTYVEVKPTFVFLPEIAAEINASGCVDQAIIVGACNPVRTGARLSGPGWMRVNGNWSGTVYQWREIDHTLEFSNIPPLLSAAVDSDIDFYVQSVWRECGNRVQWNAPEMAL